MRGSIVHAADFGSSYSGNFIASLLALGAQLRRVGMKQVLVLSEIARDRRWIRDVRASGTTVHFLSTDQSKWRQAARLAEIVRGENGALLHTHFTTYDTPAWMTQRLVRPTPALVWHVHSAFPIKRNVYRITKDMLKFRLLGRYVHLVAVSEDLCKVLATRGMDIARCTYLPNGIDVERLSGQQGSLRLREQLGICERAKVALAFGWEPVTKGIDTACAAFDRLARTSPEMVLVVVGGNELRQMIAHQFGSHWPDWLRVISPVEKVAKLYAEADLFLSASRWEGFSNSVGEAMAYRLPVVTSDLPALGWAKEAPGVVPFSPGDPESLARAIQDVWAWDSPTLARKATANRDLILRKYSVDKWASSVTKVYQRILDGKMIVQ